jgi:hypothetical protein
MRPSRNLRRVTLSVTWLVLLLVSAPQFGTWMTARWRALADAGAETLTDLAQVMPGVGAKTAQGNAATAAVRHTYWQVGLVAGAEDTHVTGIRAVIETRLPQAVRNRTTNYFWVGSYLRNGSFIQVGYYVPWDVTDQAGWFYCAFFANGAEGPCAYGHVGTTGGNGTRHTYTLDAVSVAGGGLMWRAEMDAKILGQFRWSAGDSGPNAPVIYAESSGFAPHLATSQLGPVDFTQGLLVRHTGTRTYIRVALLRVVYSAANVCPPYGVRPDGHGGALIGSGLRCPTSGSVLPG